MRETALNLSGWRERGFYGRSYRVKQDITADDLRKRLHQTLDHEVEVLEHQFTRNSVQTIKGVARFIDPNTIDITLDDGAVHEYSADKFILTVGTKPHRPSYIPFDGKSVFDSDDILDIPRMPRSLAVVGGGVIGVEYATIFSALDVPITLIEARDTILDFVDRELVAELLHDLRDRGVVLRLGCKIKAVKRGKTSGCTITMDTGRVVRCDMILFRRGAFRGDRVAQSGGRWPASR